MHLAHQRAFLFQQDSMHQLYLQMREPHIDHPVGTRDDLAGYAKWPEARPTFHGGAGPSQDDSDDDDDDDDASSSDTSMG